MRHVCIGEGSGKSHETSKVSVIVNSTVLWIIAVILLLVGIVQLIQGQILFGIILIVLGCLVGPGGYSIFKNRR